MVELSSSGLNAAPQIHGPHTPDLSMQPYLDMRSLQMGRIVG